MRPHSVADSRRVGGGRGSSESDHCAAGFRTAKRVKSPAAGRRVVHDYRGQGLAESSLNCGFPAVVYLNQIEQRSQYPVDPSKAFGAGTSACGVERQLKCLNSR